jgi:CubicO group peptidase (beta-lactamase class C family)
MKKYTFIILLLFQSLLEAQTINKTALDTLISRAKQTHSSALVVYHEDKLILNECFDSSYVTLDAMSATKSFVNLGIGLLITQGHIKSIDEPVHKFYPEWNQGLKKEITIRHLLNHTSGMQALRNTREIYPTPNYVQLALCAEISDKPGTVFFYNNKAVNLLAGIIEKASGIRMDKYIEKYIFKPLNIQNYTWITDIAMYSKSNDSTLLEKGNPIAMAELMIKADDMAKVGQLVLHMGNWNGTQIITQTWFEESMKPAQPYDATCGLLWWLIYDPETSYVTFDDKNIQKLIKLGINDTLINELKTVTGRYKNSNELSNRIDSLPYIRKIGGRRALTELLRERSFFDPIYTFVTNNSKIVGWAAKGYLGQYINIFPDKKLVVVRTISGRNSKLPTDNFFDFDILSYQIVK